MALSGSAVTALGLVLSRLGQRDTSRQQAAANVLAEEQQQHTYYRDLVNDLRAQLDREHEEAQRRYERVALDRQADDQLIRGLRDTIETLRRVVLDEVAKSAAKTAGSSADEYLAHIDLPAAPTPPAGPLANP